MSRFVTGFANLLREECRSVMLHDDMTLGRLMVYAQSIEESKLKRMSRNFKRSGPSEKDQPRFKMRDPTQDGSSAPKVKL